MNDADWAGMKAAIMVTWPDVDEESPKLQALDRMRNNFSAEAMQYAVDKLVEIAGGDFRMPSPMRFLQLARDAPKPKPKKGDDAKPITKDRKPLNRRWSQEQAAAWDKMKQECQRILGADPQKP